MTTQVQINHDGSVTSNQAMSAGGHQSSTDYQETGIKAHDGLSTRHVSDHTRLNDNELIRVDGMEVTVAMARDLGLLGGHTPNGDLSVGNAVPREQPQSHDTPEPASSTGHEGYDVTVAELEAQVEAGYMSDGEANQYSTALGEVALAGLTVAEVVDVIDGMRDGTVDVTSLPSDQRQVANNLETTVQTAATQSAMSELGDAGFNRIAEIAKGDAEFNGILQQYAAMRALGKAEHSWSEFLEDAEDWARGNR